MCLRESSREHTDSRLVEFRIRWHLSIYIMSRLSKNQLQQTAVNSVAVSTGGSIHIVYDNVTRITVFRMLVMHARHNKLLAITSHRYIVQVSQCLSSRTSNTSTAVTLEWRVLIWNSGLSPLGTVHVSTWIFQRTHRQQASRISNPLTPIDLHNVTSIEEPTPTNRSKLGGR